MEYLMDVSFLLVFTIIAVLVARRSAFESTVIFVAGLLWSLAAMVLGEPATRWVSKTFFLAADLQYTQYLWLLVPLGIFIHGLTCTLVFATRAGEYSPQFGQKTEIVGRTAAAVLTGYLLASFLLALLHTVPTQSRKICGILEPDPAKRSGLVMRLAPDYQFLGLVEYTTFPHAALTGKPWQLQRPLVSANIERGRWGSYPVRYLLWREELSLFLSLDYDQTEFRPMTERVESDISSR
ncbi:MAG: hypothetical protein KDB03_16940 [Planctomycetales bacterium]|nr:hypothetical protein [Planctomycetales bacterium]